MKNNPLIIIALFAMMLPLTVYQALASEKKMPVFVSILPQKYFVEKIGGNLVEVSVMVEPGANPHTYEPKPAQMIKLSSSKIFFTIGINFEDIWLKKITAASPDIKIVRTDEGIQKLVMDEDGHEGESGDDKKSHNHEKGEPDPHIWLSPKLVLKQAEIIKNALIETDPVNSKIYEKGHLDFENEIKALDSELTSVFEKTENRKFIVFHPSWGYFAKAYNLEQVPIEIEGKQPKPAQMKNLIITARNLGIKMVFAQPQFSTQTADTIAREIGGKVAFADPLAENWAENLRKTASQFKNEAR
ncbi:metal ABC transporter solute-binding protein, Zn/Mn family [Desulforegula conservatrix]|uniref:metal ABC transporter solute-binding protein, Zn/Mn family n=1 Tax=Desulforegula conservatrix TaxID=153026 RepID=UPI000421F4A8|nr:zinc ABC transporter substrate-binding protein [Desulforegula conservatrix]